MTRTSSSTATGLGFAWLGSTVGALCFATTGNLDCKGPFWRLPAVYLSGASAAAGIAFINSLGNFAAFD